MLPGTVYSTRKTQQIEGASDRLRCRSDLVQKHIGCPRSCCVALASFDLPRHAEGMFTIEHEFDSTVITLVDEGEAPLLEDISINAFSECVTVEQLDPRTNEVQKVTLSPNQLNDLAAALDLPEGIYRLVRDDA